MEMTKYEMVKVMFRPKTKPQMDFVKKIADSYRKEDIELRYRHYLERLREEASDE